MCPRCVSKLASPLLHRTGATTALNINTTNLNSHLTCEFLSTSSTSNSNTSFRSTTNNSLRRAFHTSSRISKAGFVGTAASFLGFGSASDSSEIKKQGQLFLKQNLQDNPQTVTQLPSGLQYKVLKSGTGKVHPLISSPCDCHYEGKLLDGKIFDSSYQRGQPTTFAPNQVIAGWTEAMQLMVEGDCWELYIPPELAYGDSGVGGGLIPGGATLVFKMEIVKVRGGGKAKKV